MTAVPNWTREDQAAENAKHRDEQWPPGNGWPRVSPDLAAQRIAEVDEMQRDWQLDTLRQRRNTRLAELELRRREIESDYENAVAALTSHEHHGTGGGG